MTASDAARPAPEPIGRLLAVASGRGGVGRTFLTLQLADAFARQGARVLVADGGAGASRACATADADGAGSIADIVAGRNTVEQAVAPIRGGAREGGVDIVAGPLAGGPDAAELAAGLTALTFNYRWVLADLPSGAAAPVLRLVRAADIAVIVVTEEPATVADAYALMKRLRAQDDRVVPSIVVNGADSAAAARQSVETLLTTCQSFLGFRPHFAGSVRRAMDGHPADDDAAARDAIALAEVLADRD